MVLYKWPALPTRNCRFLLGMMDFLDFKRKSSQVTVGDRRRRSQPQAVPAPAETKPAKKTIVETATVRFEKRPFGMAPAKEDGCMPLKQWAVESVGSF